MSGAGVSARLGPAEREAAIRALVNTELQVLVVGGGVVGAGVALDAATRGLSVGLVEARDFGSGTSSRSSKLIHGGLRYLEQLNVGLVREALGERSLLLADEPSGALDTVNGEAVMRLIHTYCKRGVAAVVVTHDAQLASWADRVVFLRDGRVVDQTAAPAGPETLLEQPS